MNAQDFRSYQWENRLVVLLSEDTKEPLVEEQLKEFSGLEAELADRKLLVFQVSPGKIKKDWKAGGAWEETSAQLYSRYKDTSGAFEVLLIGLDGGVKVRRTEPISKDELFGRIDAMPMRRAELRRRQ